MKKEVEERGGWREEGRREGEGERREEGRKQVDMGREEGRKEMVQRREVVNKTIGKSGRARWGEECIEEE